MPQHRAVHYSGALTPWPLPPVAPLPSSARPGAGTAPTRLPPPFLTPLSYKTRPARLSSAQLSLRSAAAAAGREPMGGGWEVWGGSGGRRGEVAGPSLSFPIPAIALRWGC